MHREIEKLAFALLKRNPAKDALAFALGRAATHTVGGAAAGVGGGLSLGGLLGANARELGALAGYAAGVGAGGGGLVGLARGGLEGTASAVKHNAAVSRNRLLLGAGATVAGVGALAANKSNGKPAVVKVATAISPSDAAPEQPTEQATTLDAAQMNAQLPSPQGVLALLMALRVFYQHAHWTTKGPLFFQKHKLLEALYDKANDDVDGLAERIVGLTSPDALQLPQLSANVASALSNVQPGRELEIGQAMEEALQGNIGSVLQAAASGGITPGFENLLQQLYDNSESRVYLLKQSLL